MNVGDTVYATYTHGTDTGSRYIQFAKVVRIGAKRITLRPLERVNVEQRVEHGKCYTRWRPGGVSPHTRCLMTNLDGVRRSPSYMRFEYIEPGATQETAVDLDYEY